MCISLFLLSQKEYNSDQQKYIDQTENLHNSAMQGINHDEYAEINGYASEYIYWSFSTSPSQIINVWAVDALQLKFRVSLIVKVRNIILRI